MDNPKSDKRYLNAILTVIACLLGIAIVERGPGMPQTATASAATPADRLGPPQALNSAEQRKQILREIEKANERLGKIEAQLRKGLDVNVKSMPAIEVKEPK